MQRVSDVSWLYVLFFFCDGETTSTGLIVSLNVEIDVVQFLLGRRGLKVKMKGISTVRKRISRI